MRIRVAISPIWQNIQIFMLMYLQQKGINMLPITLISNQTPGRPEFVADSIRQGRSASTLLGTNIQHQQQFLGLCR